MSEQTPRRRRADRVYTPEENDAAPCRRRMNADEPPRRRRTREYYSPEEFIPYPAEDSFDTMPPDIPFDVPPDTPSAPPKRKFRLPPLGESLRKTMQLLRSARPDFPFHSPHGVGDLLNMLLDALLWLPKLTVHLALYACRSCAHPSAMPWRAQRRSGRRFCSARTVGRGSICCLGG